MRWVWRALILLVVALAVLFVVGDRLAVSAADRAIAVKARNAAQLNETPSVSIEGFPFLTQAANGKYRKIKVTAHGIRRGGVRIDTIHAEFSGVHVALSDVLAGRVSTVPIDKSTGDILITYVDLATFLNAKSITVTQAGKGLSLSARVPVAGQTVTVTGTYGLSVSGNTIVLNPPATSLLIDGAPVASAVLPGVTQALTVRIDAGTLPFGLKLSSANVTAEGIRVDAVATGLVFPVPGDAGRT